MTIRKVSGATSGLVTKAELVVSAPFIGKAVVTQQQLLATARTEVDIIKVAAQQTSAINRLIYDDEGGASRLLRSFLLIDDAPLILIGKTFTDILSVTDLLELINLQLGRVLTDAVEIQERPAFVLARPLSDETSIVDPREIILSKSLADAVGMLDDFSLGDGNVFDLGLFRSDQILMDQQLLLVAAFNRIFQEDTAQLDRTSLQFGFNPTDVVQVLESIFVSRIVFFSDFTDAADRPALAYGKSLSDVFSVLSLAGVGDGNVFNFGLNLPAETLTIDQSHSKIFGKNNTDSLEVVDFDQRIVQFYRVFEDITAMLDLIGVGDGSEFFLQLPQQDSVAVEDPEFNLYWTALRSFEHGTEILDVSTRQAIKGLSEVSELADVKTLSVSKNFGDAVTALSLAGIGDGSTFFFASYLADIVAATDPAFSLLYLAARSADDTVLALEQSAREFSKAIVGDAALMEQQRQLALLKQLSSAAVPATDISTLSVALGRQDLLLASDQPTTHDITKALLDISRIEVTDAQREFTVLKTVDADEQELTDFFARRFDAIRGERDGFADFTVLGSLALAQVGKFNNEELFYNDVFARIFVAGRRPEEDVPAQDQIFKFETRTPFDDMQAADQRVVLLASKQIFDDTTMQDLLGAGDGSLYRLSMDKFEVLPVSEFYARRIRFRRRARDGFIEEVPILDVITILVPIVAGDPPGFDGVTIIQLDEQAAGRRDLSFFTNLGKFEDVPAEQVFSRRVNFFRFPHHNEAEAAAQGSDGFGNFQPLSDDSALSPYPAKRLETFIPSPTKSDTTSVEVKAGGVSSTATNFMIYSEQVGDANYWNPGLRNGVNVTTNYASGPDGSVSSASLLSAVGTGVAEVYIGYQVTSITNLASLVAGRTYYFSVWLRAETTSTPIRLAADLNGGAIVFGTFTPTPVTLTTSWTRVQLAFVPAINTASVFIGTTASSGNWGDQDAGGSGDNILAWGAQVSEFSSSTYVKTLADPFTGFSVAQRNQPGYEQTKLFVDIDAKAGASYSIRNKFIDWTVPARTKVRNSGLQNSSNLVSFLPRDRDSVGIIDSSLTYVYNAGRFGFDELLIGRQDGDPGYRLYGANAETTRFFFNKRGTLFDGGTSAVIVGLPYGFRVSDGNQERLSYFLTARMRRSVTSTTSGVTDLFSTYLDPVYAGQRSNWEGNTGTFPSRRSGDQNEQLSIRLEKTAKQGVARSFSGNTVTAQDLERIYVGTQEPYGFRVSGENLENVRFFNIKAADQDTPARVILGIPEYGFRVSDTLLEQTKFNILYSIRQGVNQTVVGHGTSITTYAGARGSRVYAGDPTGGTSRRSGSTLENTSYFLSTLARRGVAGSTQIKTIEFPTYPLLNALTSVLVSRTAMDLDDIGVYDQMDIRYSGAQRIFDTITIGTDAGFRVYDPGINPETVKFFFIKRPGDTVPMLDLTDIFDGLNSFITMSKAEQTTFGRGHTSTAYPERRSGTDLERMAMFLGMIAYQSVNRTFSGNTVTARDLERIYVGTQETWGFRVSGENLENVRYFFNKAADQDTPTRVVLGIPEYGFRVSNTLLEQTRFNITRLIKQGAALTVVGHGTSITTTVGDRGSRVYVGDPTAYDVTSTLQTRRSGTTLENTSYWFDKNARRGVDGSTLISTIDPTPDLLNFSDSSVAVVKTAMDLDDVGSLDSLNLFYVARRPVVDSILIGGDQLDGYSRFSGTTLENLSYLLILSKTDATTIGTANIGNVNLLRYSENFGFVSGAEGWARNNTVTVTANDVTYADPLGGFTASRIQSIGTNAYIGQELTTSSGLYTQYLIANRPMTFSVWLRADAGSSFSVNLSADTNAGTIAFNATTSVALTSSWQRYRLTFTPTVAVPRVFIGGGSTFTSGEAVYAWGAQLNFGSRVPDYVATTTQPYYENDRYSGDALENTSFFFDKRALRGATSTTSGITDLFTANLDPVYVGQRPFQGFDAGARRSGDTNERLSYFQDKQLLDANDIVDRNFLFTSILLSRSPADITAVVGLDNTALLLRLDAKQSISSTFTGAFTSVTTQASDRERVFIGDPSLAPRRSGSNLENISYFFNKDAKFGRSSTTVTIQTIAGNNGIVSSVAVTQNTSSTDLVGTLSNYTDVRTFVRFPHHNTFDDEPGAFDDFALPGDNSNNSPYPAKLLLKRVYVDDGSMGTSRVVIGTTPVVFGNLLRYSDDLTVWTSSQATTAGWVNYAPSAVWTSSVNVVAGQTDPLGGTGAFKLDARIANSLFGQYTIGSTVGAVSGNISTFSVWMRHPATSVTLSLYVDLDGAGIDPTINTSITATTTWQQFQLNFTPTTSNPVVWIGGGSSFSTGETVIVWRPQINYGRTALAYVGTTGSPVILTTQSRYSGDTVENVSHWFDKAAKRSVAGTVQLNTIDPNPDVEFAVSSVLVSRSAVDVDEVGTIDRFSLTYLLFRFFEDYPQLGSGIDQRQTDLERISFVLTKLISGDGSNILDLVGVGDGSTFSFGLNERETQIVGSGQTSQAFPARTRSGAAENVALKFDKTAQQGLATTVTVSGITTTAADTDRLFVGQQYGDVRLSGDPMERLVFNVAKLADQDSSQLILAGSAEDRRSADLENVKFSFIGKRANLFDGGTSTVAMGTALTGYNSGNLIAYSEQVAPISGSWIVTNGSITANTSDTTYTNPLGGSTGVTSLRPTTTNRYLGQQITSTLVVGQPYNWSMWVRTTGSSIAAGLYADTNGGTVSFDAGTAFTATGTWTRFSTNFTPTTTVGVRVFIGNATVWDTNEELFVWGAQVTAGTAPLTYVATTSTPAVTPPVPDRYSNDSLENFSYFFDKSARRSVDGSVQLNTIEYTTSSDLFWAGSSVLASRTSMDRDEIGTVDYLDAIWLANRTFDQDSIIAGSDQDFRYSPLERTNFFVGKRLGPEYSLGSSNVIMGHGLDQARGNDLEFLRMVLLQRQRDITPALDNSAFSPYPARFFIKDAKQSLGITGTTVVVSSNTVLADDRDRIFVGQQSWQGNSGGFRNSGDSLERIVFRVNKLADQDSSATVQAGSAEDRRSADLERIRFFVGKRANLFDGGTSSVILGRERTSQTFPERRSGDQLDNPALFVGLTAYRGTTGTLVLNTIDSNPDVEFAQSSVAIVQAARSRDAVGTLDLFSLFYAVGRIFEDNVTIGSGADFRYSPLERTNFFVGKRLGQDDGSEILDLTGIFDGLNYFSAITKRDTQTMLDNSAFSPYPARFFIKDAKQGSSTTTTVSGVTVTAADLDRVFVGQQYGNIRLSGDPMERLFYRLEKLADQDSSQTVQAGSAEDRRSADLERIRFTLIAKRANLFDGGTSSVILGRGTTSVTWPERRSGDQLDNPAFFFSLDAKKSVSSNQTFKLLDAIPGVGDQSSTTVLVTAATRDVVGIIDYFNSVLLDTGRRFFDTILIGSGVDQARGNDLERVRYFVGKRLGPEYSLGSSNVIIGHGLDQARGNDLEYLNLFITKRANLVGGGTSNVVIGRGVTSVAFPERRSGDSLDNPAFRVEKTADANSSQLVAAGSGQDRRSADLERIRFTLIGKRADQDSSATVQAGSAEDRRSADLERIRFTFIGKRANLFDGGTSSVILGRGTTSVTYPERRSGDGLDNPTFFVDLKAKKGINGNQTFKFIDPTNGNSFQSSNQVLITSYSPDITGMIDYLEIILFTGRVFLEDVLIGSSEDRREALLERIVFFVSKRLGQDDGSEILDLTDIFDGLNYNAVLSKRETLLIGNGSSASQTYPARAKSGSGEIVGFDFAKTAQIRGTVPVNQAWSSPYSSTVGLAIAARHHTNTQDPVFVGSMGYKNSADILSNTSLTSIWVQQTITGQYTSGSVYTLSGYFRRPVGSSDIALDVGTTGFSITATSVTRSVSDAWSRVDVQFIAPRTSITIRIRSLDTGGTDTLEVFGVQINSGNTVTSYVKTTTAIVAANRLLHSEDLDNAAWVKSSNTIVYANVTQAPSDFWAGTDWARPGDSQEKLIYRLNKLADQDSSQLVAIGGDQLDGEARFSGTTLENIRYTAFKRATLDDGTNRSTEPVTIGFGTSAPIVYPARRSGEELENFRFFFEKTAKQGSSTTTTVSGITVTAAAPDRLFVGQQTWQGFAAGARRSGDRNELIAFDVLKDGIAENREILENFAAVWTAKLNDGVGQMFHDAPATDFFVINNLKDHYEDTPATDVQAVLDIVKALGLGSGAADLQGTDDINNVSTQGSLRNIGYADIEYFAQDFVGDSRTLF